LQTGPQTWDITAETDDGRLTLSMGGTILQIDGKPITTGAKSEYANLYDHFAALVRERRIDVDLAPFQLVADALLCGRHIAAPAFLD